MSKRMIIMLVAFAVVFGLVFGLKGMLNFGMNQFFDNMPMPAATVTATEAVSDEWVLALDADYGVSEQVVAELAALPAAPGVLFRPLEFEGTPAALLDHHSGLL